ncbi:MAG: hypothetical protein H6Q89_254 [Myxococcaceae bacterium]|nr:hypothetical protein [Myxococcaceae bacterium]
MIKLWAVTAIVLSAGPGVKTAPARAPKLAPAPAPSDLWDFDGLKASVAARGEPTDELSTLAVAQLGGRLEGNATLKASAHPNTVGGVTLRLEDPADPTVGCSLYATREGDGLIFRDGRCAFAIFQDALRTTATCRRISGTARRVKDTVVLDASAPDCTAQPMGLPLSVRATLRAL